MDFDNSSTNATKVKLLDINKPKAQQKLVLRGFKSLTRKNMYSPTVSNYNTNDTALQTKNNQIYEFKTNQNMSNNMNKITSQYNKENIKDNINTNINTNIKNMLGISNYNSGAEVFRTNDMIIRQRGTNSKIIKIGYQISNIKEESASKNSDILLKNDQHNTIGKSKQQAKENQGRNKSNSSHGFRKLHGRSGSHGGNRSSSKHKQRIKQNQKDKKQIGQYYKSSNYLYQNSPVSNTDFKQYGYAKPIPSKLTLGSNKKPLQSQLQLDTYPSQPPSSPQSSTVINPPLQKTTSKSNLSITYPSPASILCETTSKDGNYRVISRALNVQQLKSASELEFSINLKAKKQAIKEFNLYCNNNNTQNQGNIGSNFAAGSPKFSKCKSNGNIMPKYTLDPSKISNKQNGNIKAYSVNSNQGISRKYNQDRVSIILNIMKNGVKASFFAIYDGHGGANCCDFLTQNLHQFVFNSKYFPSQPRQALIQGMKLAQTKYIQIVKKNFQDKKQLDRSGSCAIILLVVGDDCYIANLGDSRAVLSTSLGKPMYSLSRDHKPTDPGQQARILKQGGKVYRTQMFKIKKQVYNTTSNHQQQKQSQQPYSRTHSNSQFHPRDPNHNRPLLCEQSQVILGPLRVYPGKLSVTRTFGDIQAKQPQFGGIRNCISTDPQVCKYTLTGKQDFIMLGCDGVYEKLDSQEVIEETWKAIKSVKLKNKQIKQQNIIHQAAGAAAQSVVKLCMDRKSTDNITVIMICLGSLGLESNLSDYASI